MYTCWIALVFANLNLKDDNDPQQNAAWSVQKTQAQDAPQNSEELFGNTRKHKHPAVTAVSLSNEWNFDIPSSSDRCNQGQLSVNDMRRSN